MIFRPGDTCTSRYPHIYVLARGSNIVSSAQRPGEPLPAEALPLDKLQPEDAHYIGDYGEAHCFALQVSDARLPLLPELEVMPLRSLLGEVSDVHFQMLGRALQITRWYREHRYCGVCGRETHSTSGHERALACGHCEQRYFPRISPCVICLVSKGNQVLLARHARHRHNMFTTLAGFIEPGETAEEAVHREIWEEVDIRVKNLRYFRSQSWPFPGQLMLGFAAEYASGELRPDGVEILEAHWFDVGDLPLLPPPSTISAQLIHNFVESKRTNA